MINTAQSLLHRHRVIPPLLCQRLETSSKKLRLGTLMPHHLARLRLRLPGLPGLGHISNRYRMDLATRGR